MKIFLPLSLKISLWLILNLLLLGLGGAFFLVRKESLGWNGLVAGPAGERAQFLGSIVASSVAVAPRNDRNSTLARFAAVYRVDLALFDERGDEIARSGAEPPKEARSRASIMPRPMMAHFPDRGAPMDWTGGPLPPMDDRDWQRGGSPNMPPMPGDGRFLVRTPGAVPYWIGVLAPYDGGDYPGGLATVLIGAPSLWSLIWLLGLGPWILGATTVLTFSVIFWFPLVRGITRALAQLTSATAGIAEGRFDTRVPARRRDELGRLGESVNRMAGQLDSLVNGQRRFLGDVAHELCSPLARLQLATGILEEQAAPELRGAVTDVRHEVDKMSSLVNELLAFTKAGLRPPSAPLVAVDLPALVVDVLQRECAGARVRTDIPAGLRACAEPALLTRALCNLVRNAIRYAGNAGDIAISARAAGGAVVIAVDDNGPGVPAGTLAHLGEPFYRPEAARTPDLGGVGLGLAIVRNCALACGGEVRFANREPRGFRAELRLAEAKT